MRRLFGFIVVPAMLVVVGSAAAAGSSATGRAAFARQGAPQELVSVLPPARRPTKTMHWATERPPMRRLAATRYGAGLAVVGLGLGTTTFDFGPGVSVVGSDPALHAVEVAGDPAELAALESNLAREPGLRYVEPLEREVAQHERSDPATFTVDPTTGLPYEWAFQHVGLDRALNITPGDSRILVGIVDSGWSQIPEILSKVAESWYFIEEGTNSLDTLGHGTFVASLIAAQNDDGYGLAGYCGACRIIPFRVVNLNSLTVAAAIDKLVDEQVRIINLSLGGGPSLVMLDAVNYAISKGVLLVASSGNDGVGQAAYPAAWLTGDNGTLGWGLSVGASGPDDQRIFFSNYGSRISLVAPGAGTAATTCQSAILGAISVPAADFDAAGGCSRIVDIGNGQRYAYASGTSFSAPEVAGVAALVMAARPDLTNSQVANVIEQSASRPSGTGWQPDVGWGVLNAAAALEMASGRSSADSVHLSRPQVSGTRKAGSIDTATADLEWQDSASVNAGTAGCSVQIGGRSVAAAVSIQDGTVTCRWKIPATMAGKPGKGTLSGADTEGDTTTSAFTFKVAAALRKTKK
jgi:subtilisin family serine protease